MRYLSFLFVVMLAFCKNENIENQLVVTVEKIALRAAPGVKGAETGTLRQGDAVYDLGEVSHFESEIVFGERAIQAPWLKVRAKDHPEGWVFAGAVAPAGDAISWLRQKRLDCYFGHAFNARLNRWLSGLNQVRSEEQFAAAYREALAIRDTMFYALGRRSEPEQKPKLQWLSELMPGFVLQQNEPGSLPFLFVDYRFWVPLAQQTSGTADDAFLQTCIRAFPRDSIESLFPVWKFQLSETTGASQLGKGLHLAMLQQVDETLAGSSVFEPELMHIKDAVLEDILDKNTGFWQPAELILEELDDIIARPPACLNNKETATLQLRRTMIEHADQRGIRVDLRSGE